MKSLFFLLILLSLSAPAFADCEDYEFQGNLRLHDKAFFLHIHEGTLSEIKIQITIQEELKFLPYHDELVKGKFKDGAFVDLDFAVPGGREYLEKKEGCE